MQLLNVIAGRSRGCSIRMSRGRETAKERGGVATSSRFPFIEFVADSTVMKSAEDALNISGTI